MARRAALLALLGGGAAFAIACVAVGRAHPGWWFAGESDTAAALELAAGFLLMGAGAAAWHRQPASAFGPLLWLAGMAWFVPELNNPEIGSSVAFTAGLAFIAAGPPLVCHAALAYPAGRLRSPAERIAVAVAYVGSIALIGGAALFFDPGAEGCAACPGNLLLVSADGDLAADLQRTGLRLGAVWSGLVLVLAAARMARGSVAERRLQLPVLVPAAAYVVAVAWSFWRGADRGFLGNDSFDLSLWTAQAASLSLLAAGTGWAWVRGRRTRSALASLVVDLERSPGPGGLRAALARRLGDPELELLYELPGGRLVDAAGASPRRDAGRQLTRLPADERTLAVVAHRPGLFDDPGLAPEVASAARLALDKERLQAELRAQLRDLRASRARIVEAADAERRRLERDLHDGAQQRLVGLSLSIGIAIAESGGDATLEAARAEATRLLGDLRELAHGLYPVALAEEGLAAAVDVLAEQSQVALRIDAPFPEERLDPRVESAAYLVLRQLTRDGRRTWASIEPLRLDDRLVIAVAGDGGPPGDLVLLEDHVGAAGGTLSAEGSTPDSLRLRAELPCG